MSVAREAENPFQPCALTLAPARHNIPVRFTNKDKRECYHRHCKRRYCGTINDVETQTRTAYMIRATALAYLLPTLHPTIPLSTNRMVAGGKTAAQEHKAGSNFILK